MADDQMDGASVLAGLPDINAEAGQSTIGALLSPEQIGDVDWGEEGPPDLGPALPWTVGGQNPRIVSPGRNIDPGFDAPRRRGRTPIPGSMRRPGP